MELELGDLLQEFQEVVEVLKAPSQTRAQSYHHVLQEAKGRAGQSEASFGNSLNSSEEELNTAGLMQTAK
uniref:Uncharacterized protein n=1 Tax=Periophthalmus magnuspinnatus TaxID=409849 RepID=A0A3B3ZE67_9GOBI